MKHKLYIVLLALAALTFTAYSGVVTAEPNNRFAKNDSDDRGGNRVLIKNGKDDNKNSNNKNSNNTVIINSSDKNNNKNKSNKNNNKNSNNTVVINSNNKKQNNNVVIVNPNNKNNKHKNNVVVVKPAPKPIVVQPVRGPWFRPIVPGWHNWHGGKVVIVDNHHHHYSAFAVAMTALAIAIVVDESSGKSYTDDGKPVTIKERSCHKGQETEVIELENELLILTC